MMLSLDTAYRSFGGEVEASSTPTICRLSDSRRHQLWAIAHIERTALQNVASGGWFPAGKLLPAQKKTIAKMMVKGWIERQSGDPLYRITADGLAALKAPIPESRHLR
jgi:hypothetical protein